MKKLMLVLILFSQFGFGQKKPVVLIAYFSSQGHTRAMAEAVAKGARSIRNVDVKLLTVGEATNDDVLTADAIIVGSPVHNANVAVEVQQFINKWPFDGAPLKDKIGAVFVTAGGISAGEELAQMNVIHSMLVFGLIIVGGPDWRQPFGASAITGEKPFASPEVKDYVEEDFLKKGEALGKRVASVVTQVKRTR